jgi:hypothetical protein
MISTLFVPYFLFAFHPSNLRNGQGREGVDSE